MVRLTDHLDMTIVLDWDVKPQNKQTRLTLILPNYENRNSARNCPLLASNISKVH